MDLSEPTYNGLTVPVETETFSIFGKKKKTRGKKAGVQLLKGGRLRYKGAEYVFPKNSYYADLSQKVYQSCRPVNDFVAIDLLYREWKGRDYFVDPMGNWRLLSNTIRSANRWAKQQGLPTLFKCTKRGVITVGIEKVVNHWK
jgi:hypothetical protein